MKTGFELEKTLEYLEKNLSGRLRLEDMAKKANISKYHFDRLFHRATGESFRSFVARRRMAKAAAELVLSDERILDIAFRYQYGSQEAFTRAFERLYGVSPARFRRLNAPVGLKTAGISGSVTDRAA